MKTKTKPAGTQTTSTALTHSPFAKLRQDSTLRVKSDATQPVSSTPAQTSQTTRPCKLSLRLETAGRSGKAVTRIRGLPPENLEAIASLLRKGLGCGSTMEGSDVLLLGSLVERATEWLQRAGDLRSLALTKAPPLSSATTSAAEARAPQLASVFDGTRRADVRRGASVSIVQKADQATGRTTEGVVRDVLTNSDSHPRGIKVRLESGEVGRIKKIYG